MKPELKTKWIEALRSGDYHQGRYLLHVVAQRDVNKEKFCCLGVLAVVMGAEKDSSGCLFYNGKPIRRTISALRDTELGTSELLNRDIEKDSGLLLQDQEQLSALNDGERDVPRKNFNEIADWIEENL